MSAEFWAILGVGLVLWLTLIGIGDKLSRVIKLLEIGNDQTPRP